MRRSALRCCIVAWVWKWLGGARSSSDFHYPNQRSDPWTVKIKNTERKSTTDALQKGLHTVLVTSIATHLTQASQAATT